MNLTLARLITDPLAVQVSADVADTSVGRVERCMVYLDLIHAELQKIENAHSGIRARYADAAACSASRFQEDLQDLHKVCIEEANEAQGDVEDCYPNDERAA